jgi:hypothetical protein
MIVEERKDVGSTRREHGAMIAAGDFDVLVRHLKLFHIIDPSSQTNINETSKSVVARKSVYFIASSSGP